MSKYKIAAIPVTLIDVVWHMLVPHLQRVVELVPTETTLDLIYNKAMSGELLLITISEGTDITAVVTADIRDFDTGLKALHIPMVGGENMQNWIAQLHDVMIAIAKDFGCQQLRAGVRKGWLKTLKQYNWQEEYTIVRLDLE